MNDKYETLIYYDTLIPENEDLRIIDLAESMLGFQIILTQYKRLLEKYNCNIELNIKYKFRNFNSITPFMDSMEHMNFISENEIPINLKTSIDVPNIGYLKYQFKNFEPFSLTLNILSATGFSRHLIDVIAEGYTNI